MSKCKMIMIGKEESFISRILIKKVLDIGVDISFVPWTVGNIDAAKDDISLISLYIDEGEKPDEVVLRFLSDIMKEKNIRMILVGEDEDLEYVRGYIPEEYIQKTFTRPVDNRAFVSAVSEFASLDDSGEIKRSVLIVDDDPQYLTMVREWLKGTYKVSMANSGLQAIKWLGKNKVDLILLDYEMPAASGPQVFSMLRSDVETKDIPIIFLTGKDDKDSVMSVLALKPEGYILKTVQKNELLSKIQEFFLLH